MTTSLYTSDPTALTTDVGLYQPSTPLMLTTPFNGTLANSTAHIGNVSIDGPVTLTGFPTSIALNNSLIPVKIVASDIALGGGGGSGGTSFDGVIKNSSSQPIPVTIQGGSSSFSGSLSAGNQHIGQVSLDQPISLANGTQVGIQGLVSVGGSVSLSAGTTVGISGTVNVAPHSVSVSNQPTSLSINNTSVNPVPVTVQGGSTFDGVLKASSAAIGKVTVDDTTAIRVNVVSGGTGGSGGVQEVTGSVTATISGTPAVSVAGAVTISNPYDGVLKLAGAAVSSANRLPVDVQFPTTQAVSISGTPAVTVSGTVATTLSGTPSVGIPGLIKLAGAADSSSANGLNNPIFVGWGSSAGVNILQNGSNVGGSNPLSVSFPSTPSVNATISNPSLAVTQSGTWTVGLSGTPSVLSTLQVAGSSVNNANPLPVSIVGGSTGGGGSSFNGQLTQGGTEVSTANRLPVDVVFPTNQTVAVSGITGLVRLDPATATSLWANNGYVSDSAPMPTKIIGTPSVNSTIQNASIAVTQSGSWSVSVANLDYTTATIGSAAITGAALPVTFASNACKVVEVCNNNAADIEYQRNGAGPYMTIPKFSNRTIIGVTNANQISLRRVDQSATTISVSYEMFS